MSVVEDPIQGHVRWWEVSRGLLMLSRWLALASILSQMNAGLVVAPVIVFCLPCCK